MKALLMYPDHDFDAQEALPAQATIARQDFALDTLLKVMSGGDEFIMTISANALLNAPGNSAETIRYRQSIVADALAHPEPVRAMYAIATEALAEKRKHFWAFAGSHPSSILYSSVNALVMFMERLRTLRDLAQANAAQFSSTGFGNLFGMLQRELDDPYLARATGQLDALQFRAGALLGARLGPEGESEDYTLRQHHESNPGWLQRLLNHAPSAYTVRIAQRDMIGAKTLTAMRDRGVQDVANTLAQAVTHINGFFGLLRAELAFHIGCINLHEELAPRGVPTCFPDIQSAGDATGFTTHGLRDVSLALTVDHAVVGNTVDAAGKDLVVVTGANQGGKSTFLRSLGLAQMMLQGGMFVTAKSYAAAPCSGLFTHYKREEDVTMQQGKLDEELARIGAIADAIRPGAWLLCNESFASTNEREGSELARQVVEAMLERHVCVIFVTHAYTFAHGMEKPHRDDALFLCAQRLADGTRTYQLVAGAPRETSYGDDLYREIFGTDNAAGAVASSHNTEPAPATTDGSPRH